MKVVNYNYLWKILIHVSMERLLDDISLLENFDPCKHGTTAR